MLKFKISDISEVGASKAVDTELQVDDEQMSCKNPVRISGRLSNISDGIIEFTGKIYAAYHLICSRCMAPVDKEVEIDVEEQYGVTEGFQEDLYPIENNAVDLLPMVLDNLRLHIPMKVLCKEDCKGLCSQCGINLNLDSCSCHQDDIDPRFAVLKKLDIKDE